MADVVAVFVKDVGLGLAEAGNQDDRRFFFGRYVLGGKGNGKQRERHHQREQQRKTFFCGMFHGAFFLSKQILLIISIAQARGRVKLPFVKFYEISEEAVDFFVLLC